MDCKYVFERNKRFDDVTVTTDQDRQGLGDIFGVEYSDFGHLQSDLARHHARVGGNRLEDMKDFLNLLPPELPFPFVVNTLPIYYNRPPNGETLIGAVKARGLVLKPR